jgi:hypothetical protein
MIATHIIYAAIGRPDPHDTNGDLIKPRGSGGPCARCGEPGNWRLRDAISDNFTTVKNSSRAWPYGGSDICAACLMACKSLRLRCAMWFARDNGIWFTPTRPLIAKGASGTGRAIPNTRIDALKAILHPPEPPFVAAWPKSGVDHGGEANLHRCYVQGLPMPSRPLTKLQSKHVAIYARVATNKTMYPLQIDGHHDVVVDVELWSALKRASEKLFYDMIECRNGITDCRRSLVTARLPPRAPLSLASDWPRATRLISGVVDTIWWPLFVELLRTPKGAAWSDQRMN